MGIDLDVQNVQTEKDFGQFNQPKPGRYHVIVKDVDESCQTYQNKVVIEFEVKAGTVSGQEGCTLREFFATSEKAKPRLKALAIILGLLKGGQKKEVNFVDGIGRQLVIDVEEHQYDDRENKKVDTVRVGFLGMYRPDDADVKDVPKDQGLLASWNPDPAKQTPVNVGGSQTEAAASSAEPAGGDDPWTDL